MTIKTPVRVELGVCLMDADRKLITTCINREQIDEIADALNTVAQVRAAFESGKILGLLTDAVSDGARMLAGPYNDELMSAVRGGIGMIAREREAELRKLLGIEA